MQLLLNFKKHSPNFFSFFFFFISCPIVIKCRCREVCTFGSWLKCRNSLIYFPKCNHCNGVLQSLTPHPHPPHHHHPAKCIHILHAAMMLQYLYILHKQKCKKLQNIAMLTSAFVQQIEKRMQAMHNIEPPLLKCARKIAHCAKSDGRQ